MAVIPGKGGIKSRSGPPGNQNAFRMAASPLLHRTDKKIFEGERP
jgi:hypothetical protein